MKRYKAPGMSGLVAEMTQSTGDIGTHWILYLSIFFFCCKYDVYKIQLIQP